MYAIMQISTRKEKKSKMTRAEFEERKMWDESLMTEEEREAHLQRVLSFCGKIDDDTFIIHPDTVPPVVEVVSPVAEAV